MTCAFRINSAADCHSNCLKGKPSALTVVNFTELKVLKSKRFIKENLWPEGLTRNAKDKTAYQQA